MASGGAGISIRGLTVRAGGRALLEGVDADFPAGGITLVVGPSGAGKTILLRVLAGLIAPDDPDIEVSGAVRVGAAGPGAGGESPAARRGRVGIVFQDFALFDELGAAGNVLFALDHRRRAERLRGAARRGEARRLLEELDVPAAVPVAHLSGGQKQRLAIARTLAHDPEALVFDEPTSGLDPVNSRRVAERIRRTRERSGKTVVVVTHDHASLAPIADRVYFLDPARRTLVPLEEEGGVERLWSGSGAAEPDAAPPAALPAGRRGAGAALARAAGDVLAATARALEATVHSTLRLVPAWRSLRWGARSLLHALWLIASPSSFAYFGAAGVIAGFVSTHFTFEFLPFKAYTEPLITEELLHGLGFSLYRIVVPVLLTVLLAARCGAAVAADVGARVYGRQTDAMRSLGAPPAPYLLTGVLYAFLVATPILVAFGFAVARFTSLIVFSYDYPRHDPVFWDTHFHRHLRQPGSLAYLGTGWTLLKVLACGLGVGAVAYHVGMRPKRSGVDVSRGITVTIIWATLLVLLVHFAFAFVEF